MEIPGSRKRKLQVLVQKRRQLVDERTAQTNRITDLLKLYFPKVLDWFDEVGAPLVGLSRALADAGASTESGSSFTSISTVRRNASKSGGKPSGRRGP